MVYAVVFPTSQVSPVAHFPCLLLKGVLPALPARERSPSMGKQTTELSEANREQGGHRARSPSHWEFTLVA